jgi:hypothetical protein
LNFLRRLDWRWESDLRFRFRCVGRGVGGSEVRTSRMVERARLGEGKERLSEVGCVAPGGVGLSSGAEGRRVGRGKALDQRR